MITPEIIQRINQLAKKKKAEGLTPEEASEQAKLRRIYIDNIKAQLKDCLDRVEIVDATNAAGNSDKEKEPRFGGKQ